MKKDGRIRPIAVGLTLRRLVSKLANRLAQVSCAPLLLPTQMGVGTKGGCEALVHATRLFLAKMDSEKAFVKLDFANAFNSVRRDVVLEAVARHRPDLLTYVNAAYGSPSILWAGQSQILSAEGVQQGDPLGPLLFCLALDGPLKEVHSEFTSGYLDDVGLGDSIPRLVEQVRFIESAAMSIGLQLNHDKCEIIGLDPSQRPIWLSSGLNFIERSVEDACLLGAPLSLKGTDAALSQSCDQLERVKERLLKLSSHEAFFLLKNSLALPRLQYLLRTSPCFLSTEASRLDDKIRCILSSVINLKLDDVTWAQAALPVRWGGIGIRKLSTLSPSAFLASTTATVPLVHCLLDEGSPLPPDKLVEEAVVYWSKLAGTVLPIGQTASFQRTWDDGISSAISKELLSQADPVNRARLLASLAPGSGCWLQALPCNSLGLRLGNDELRIAVGLRLGAPLVRPHKCVCGTEVESNGHHGLACRRSAGRHRRHALANDVVLRAVRSLGVHAELEPPRLFRGDGKRPDGATLDPWHSGRYLVWDFTCPDTLAPSHINQSTLATGSAASGAEARKNTKYAELASSGDYLFAPIAVESLGVFGPSALAVCADIGGRIATQTGDIRALAFLKQRLGLAVQKGNAAAVVGTHPEGDMREL